MNIIDNLNFLVTFANKLIIIDFKYGRIHRFGTKIPTNVFRLSDRSESPHHDIEECREER